MNAFDIIVVVVGVIMLILSQTLIILAHKRPKEWQEENKKIIAHYTRAQWVLIVLFVLYLIFLIINKVWR